MSESIQGALIGAGSALVVVILSTLVNLWRDVRTREHDRTERRYDGRRAAIAHLLAEADRIHRAASRRSYESERGGPPMPVDDNDTGSQELPTLRDALAEVELLASKACALEADLLVRAVEQYAWDGIAESKVIEARRAFVVSARRDLNITVDG
ncbi:hypothetical protein [Propionicimonas sp.]|uniref:hypothetical protein n=1 Tax=Propionicimonas sp. TaxID=1955623 RepID=UPI0039E45A65